MPSHSRNRAPVPGTLRRATLVDADLLLRHRLAMFREMGDQPERTLARHGPAYLAWMAPRIASAELVAWVAEDDRGRPVGSGALWFQPSQPRPGFDDLRVPYVLSIYTEPRGRGKGVASAIVRQAVALAERLGYARVSLHASRMGRGVYERLGFEPTTELRYWIDPVQRARSERRRAAEAAPEPVATKTPRRRGVRATGRSVRART